MFWGGFFGGGRGLDIHVQLWSDQRYSSIAEIDHCMRYPCQHGGTCLKSISGWYICVCPPGYSGQNCEVSKYYNNYQGSCILWLVQCVPFIKN